MTPNRATQILKEDFAVTMAKREIYQHTANPVKYLWWHFMPGTKITVAWPTGWTEPDHLGNQTQSADPNDHFRPWLEEHVGRQGWDWDWRVGDVTEGFNGLIRSRDTLVIKFRRGREQYATMFLLRGK